MVINNEIIDAIIQLSNGDMRVAINILQSCKTIKNGYVNIDDVYKISGFCTPNIIYDIYDILVDLFGGNNSISITVEKMVNIIINNNITIFHLLDSLKNSIIVDKTTFSDTQKIYLISKLAEIEIYDSVNIDQHANIMVLASIFILCKKK